MANSKYRILLVDDDKALLRLLSMRMTAAGYEVTAVTSGEEALAHLPLLRPHLIVTDLQMDGMDGMTLFNQVHSRNPTLPVLMLTAHGTIPEAIEATSRGVFSYLTKPFNSKVLEENIARALKITGEPTTGDEEGASDAWREGIITRSPLMENLLTQARLIADSDTSVLIQGQSGTGKELLARAIHNASQRSDAAFVALNCSAIPESLFESELFGHKKGAFTGATRDHPGMFRAAEGGTLFLDEIGDMPLVFQVKLLRALQEREIRPVGSTESIPVDVRIISATHQDLEQALADNTFREDLYYRLNVVNLELPSLAQRREDITLLANHFLHSFPDAAKRGVTGFSSEAQEAMLYAAWPGNVRQLYNVVEQSVALSTTPLIPASLVQRALRSEFGDIPSFVEARGQFERDYLTQLLQITNGNVAQAARIAKRNRTEFYKLLNKHQLSPPQFKAMRS
ncbi:MAG: sigma 54-interacting transcriptional regulator [Gammaproteobacteria bacterium]|nr:sigma 54-interacting transcriptional regulator [Gammaproteobacteria bacterium]MDH5514687.1 sigma 54-interacting transcriptional regulator [Gammaproteobacteria bacterium]